MSSGIIKHNNDFDPLHVNGEVYCISHLKDLSIILNVTFENGDTRPITVHMRPTNHLFSREVTTDDEANQVALESLGYWLKSYVHHEGNYQQVKGPPLKLKESRIFCYEKWTDSFLFPEFVGLLNQQPTQITVLANAGDDKTCLSGILELSERPGMVYLVFFSFTKVNSKEVNMLVESAYCVCRLTNRKAKKLLEPNQHRDEARPFIIALKNVMEGRKPLENVNRNKRHHKLKKKRLKMQKAL